MHELSAGTEKVGVVEVAVAIVERWPLLHMFETRQILHESTFSP